MFHRLSKVSWLVFLCFGLFVSHDVQAATSYFSPSSGKMNGETGSVDILVDTEGVAVNNVEMVVRFPNDLLEIVSTSASESIFSLWVGAPKYSNESGTLSFTAGIPTPGFTGDAGKILTVVFRTKGEGQALLTFSSVVVRANDGYGSNVFRSGTRALFDIRSSGDRGGSSVKTAPAALAAPVFTDYPTELETGASLIVHGTARSESTVNVWVEKDKTDQRMVTTESDQNGRFTFFLDEKVREGVYRLWAEVMDTEGNKSAPTEKIAIVVTKPTWDRMGVFLAAIALVAVFASWYAWRTYVFSKKRLRKETLEAESSLHQAFGSLRENRERLEMFEKARTKRTLTAEEEEIVTWLKQDLNNAEKTVEKEIDDIEEEVK